MTISRRAMGRLLAASMAVTGARTVSGGGIGWAAAEATDFTAIIEEAERLSRDAFVAADPSSAHGIAELSHEQYRDIRYRSDLALWRGEDRGVEIELLHQGYHFRRPVAVSVVEDGWTRAVPFSRDLFDYGPRTVAPPDSRGLAFSGFRARHPAGDEGRMNDFATFQGASYFRVVADGQRFGLSARGLAINTAEGGGEEFPHFRDFWLIRPEVGATSMVALALLDSPSTTGAYRFTMRPGPVTIVDVELMLFPRRRIDKIGLAPLTSMFLFDATTRFGHDDYRNAVHDSNGLQILTGGGERIFRPLANPSRLQISAFVDRDPRGFGLVQRSRRFSDFHDLEARYDLRPSAWIEPVGDWGPGAVVLVEIPTEFETNDNIVAFWRPDEPVEPSQPLNLAYRMHWCDTVPDSDSLARAMSTRCGQGGDGGRRLFVVDFADMPPDVPAPTVEVSASDGEIVNVAGAVNPATGGFRTSFELDPGDASLVELRLVLTAASVPVSEIWLYRWTGR